MKTQAAPDRRVPRRINKRTAFQRLACLLLLAASLPGVPALGAPAGELDPAFGDHGRILLRDPAFDESAGVEVFVDPGNGKLLVVADGYQGDRLLRFNADGSLDPEYGDQGTALLGFGDDDATIYDVEWLADGKLLIAGAMNVYGDPDNVIHGSALLVRLHADGTPDVSFGDAGRAVFQLGGVYESISGILLQPDGIVVLGNTVQDRSLKRVFARYTEDGLPDSSFGGGAAAGVMVISVIPPGAQLAAIVRQGDAKFMACGYDTVGTGSSASNRILAARFLPSGAPDTTFGDNGIVQIDGGQSSVAIYACLELADGHFIFAGSAGSGDQKRAAAWRLTPDGALDPGFGSNGMKVLDTNTESVATSMLVMADGSLAIAGTQWQPDAQWKSDNNAWGVWADMLVARIDPTSGDVDQEFGNQGTTAIDFGAREYASNAIAASLRQQPDGKLVIVGSQVDIYDWWHAYSIAIARIDPYGAGSNGWASMTDSYVYAPSAGGALDVHLRRTGGSTGALTVDYRTVAGTATAGENYVATSGTVSWPDGDLSEKTISVTVMAAVASSSKTFNVELSNSSGGLGMDQAIIYISAATPVPYTPPSTVVNNNAGGGSSGGGAIGVELWLLMVLAALGIARRTYLPGNRR